MKKLLIGTLCIAAMVFWAQQIDAHEEWKKQNRVTGSSVESCEFGYKVIKYYNVSGLLVSVIQPKVIERAKFDIPSSVPIKCNNKKITR